MNLRVTPNFQTNKQQTSLNKNNHPSFGMVKFDSSTIEAIAKQPCLMGITEIVQKLNKLTEGFNFYVSNFKWLYSRDFLMKIQVSKGKRNITTEAGYRERDFVRGFIETLGQCKYNLTSSKPARLKTLEKRTIPRVEEQIKQARMAVLADASEKNEQKLQGLLASLADKRAAVNELRKTIKTEEELAGTAAINFVYAGK